MGTHTPGPWAWMGNQHGLYLATTHSGRRYVMGFRRMGFNGAQPVFRANERMVPASDIVEFEVGDRDVRGFAAAKEDDSVYRYDVDGIDNADARLIAAAPDLLEALQEARDALHQHYVDWDGEPEDAVPLQLAIAKCDEAIARAAYQRGE